MIERKKILVAAGPSGQYRALKALAGEYALQFASTLREAKELLRESETGHGSSFSTLIGDVFFDDSRMFELLQYVRTVDHYDKVPFLAMQSALSDLGGVSSAPVLSDSTRASAELLGACAFLELQDLPEEKANKILLETVERSFYKTVEKERIDQGGSERKDPDSIPLD